MSYSVYRINQLEQQLYDGKIKQEAIELALIYAQDIVNTWPQLTMRTLGTMTDRINTLRQALEEIKKINERR